MNEKDIVIIGGGPGGYVAAIHAAHLGADVALVEKSALGGTCLNHGCIPTKTLVKSTETLLESKNAHEFGIELDNISVNFPAIMARKDRIVDQLRKGIEQLITGNKISLYQGQGCILSPHLVKVNDQEIATKNIVIASGSEATSIPVPGIDLPGVLNTNEILELDELPESLVIIGGGYVGVEFAGIFNTLGTKVTIIEKLPSCLDIVDNEICNRFIQTIRRKGTEIQTDATVKSIQKEGTRFKVTYETQNSEKEIEAQVVLVATGRQPYTEGLGLEGLDIAMDRRAIEVNEYLETNIPGIYAIGDVTGKYMLAHVASHEGRIAVENALGRSRQADYRAIPGCIFTNPEIAYTGISEKEAKESNISYNVSKFPLHACDRAIVMGETVGLVKLICDADNGKVLGMHIMGPHASDLITEGVLAIQMGATVEDLANTIHAHPTLSEAVHDAAMGQLEGSIHYQRR